MKILQQVGLLAAGAQPWHVDICSGNGKYFVFSATLAVYIHEVFTLFGYKCIDTLQYENLTLVFALVVKGIVK